MIANLLSNPLLLLAVIIFAVIISWLLKASKKIIFWIICIGLAYFVVTQFGII